jgi:hypothetical protein
VSIVRPHSGRLWSKTAREIREYFVPDFSDWKDHDSYAKVPDRLVRT